jgi:hypothetical protein
MTGVVHWYCTDQAADWRGAIGAAQANLKRKLSLEIDTTWQAWQRVEAAHHTFEACAEELCKGDAAGAQQTSAAPMCAPSAPPHAS